MKESFDYRKKLYDFGGTESQVRNIQKKLIKYFKSGWKVLDIGCGRGVFLDLLKENGIQGFGIDLSEISIEYCKNKGLENVFSIDVIEYLDDIHNEYNGIFCSHVIEHMDSNKVLEFVDKCYQALLPGGRMVLITPNPMDLMVISEFFWLDLSHVRPYPLELMVSITRNAGFAIDEAKVFLGGSLLNYGRRNLIRNIFLKLFLGRYFGKPNSLLVVSKPTV